jgi:hypothetical protein
VKKKVSIAKGVKVTPSKAASLRKKPGGSNVGAYKGVPKKDFAGPAGGSPQGSYPIPNVQKAKSALKLARNAPNPSGIKAKVYKKFPQLKS